MFTNSFKLDGIDNILQDIGYLEELKGAGEDQEHKYPNKSGKKSKDYDDDGTVEDETDEYAGVKDRAIKKAMAKKSKNKDTEDDTKCEEVDFSSVLDELTDEDLLFLTDDLIEEVVEEFFYETLEEGYEIDQLEALLLEQVESELTYLEEAKVTVGHDSDVQPEASRTSRLSQVKNAIKKVASGAKNIAKKVAHGAGEVAGSAVAGYKKASAAAKDAPSATKTDTNTSKNDSPNTGSSTTTTTSASKPAATGTQRPGILGRIGSALKSGLKKAVHGAGKAVGKVVKTAKAGYDEGRGKAAPAPAAPAAAKAKPTPKTSLAKKKSNLDDLLDKVRKEQMEIEESLKQARKNVGASTCWKGYEAKGTKMKNGRSVPNCVPKEEYEDLERDMLEEGYTFEQVLEVIAAYEDGFEVIFEEDGVVINETQEMLDEEFLSDVEVVADWLYAEGIIENEDEFFELMEELTAEEVEELYDVVLEATAMAKRGYDETKLRQRAGGGEAADRATALENRPTYGDANKAKQRQNYARAQRGDFRKTASSNPGLHVGQHKSNDPKVKAVQAARGAQRGALTPKEKKQLNMGYEMIGNSLEEGGLEVQNIQEISANLALRASKAADIKRGKLAVAGDREGAAAKAAQAKRLYDKQAAKRKQEGAEMIGSSLEEGGLEVRNYSWKEVMESQYARNNPEKYEGEQKKKYAPVRGEKTPMPPRGDKRREDFEKWYAKNVR